ncbi:Hypothetical predicted protein [Pelobates cultripes]|uniref:Uncharacterized protein n=1 Tax=Pelobates cultripes TaxID=61616 RepID=A0AAD1W4P0_PELCU|nr:Hypothetical predicted protein [Pelobates cultripes]
MGNKKKPTTSQDASHPTPHKKAGDLDRYFRDKIKVLLMEAEDSVELPSLSRDSLPQRPAFSELSMSSRDTDLHTLIQNLPSKTDIASMLAGLESSMQVSSLAQDIRHVGHWVTDLEGEVDVIRARLHNI